MSQSKIGIIGSGSWGTALASVVANNKYPVTIYSRNTETVSSINNQHINHLHFPEIKLNPLISATFDISDLDDCEFIFLALPVQSIRYFCEENSISNSSNLVLCSKGIESTTGKLPSQIIEEIAGNNTVVLSGPNFAKEIIQTLPAAAIIASENNMLLENLTEILNQKNFKIYSSQDKIGVQIAGAMKNVIAIFCGICEGKNLGDNTKAMIITMAIKEMSLMIEALGGSNDTMLSLAGIGDLILTTTGDLSRNKRFGTNLVKNENHIISETVEGFYTAKILYEISRNLGLELPISKSVYKILHLKESIDESLLQFFS